MQRFSIFFQNKALLTCIHFSVLVKLQEKPTDMAWVWRPLVLLGVILALIGRKADCVEPIAQEFVTIDTDLGKIRGIVKSARNGKPFEACTVPQFFPIQIPVS